MKAYFKLLALILLSVVLKGCVAAAPLAYLASGVFFTFKTVQITTGGSAEVRFAKKEQEVSEEARKELTAINRLAMLPGHPINTALAESLSDFKHFEVVTPYQIEQADPGTMNRLS